MPDHPVTAASRTPGRGDFLLALATGDSERLVLNQEAAGGQALLQSSLIPKERGWVRPGEPHPDEAWLALGFTFGTEVDDLFQECTLPEGWTRKSMSDPRGSYVLDERGVERVSVFYKAAFYDRDANASLINVGRQVATHAIYGDEAAPVVPHLDVLTAAERAAAVETCRYYLGDAQRTPQIYGDREARARAALALLGEPDAEPIVRESPW